MDMHAAKDIDDIPMAAFQWRTVATMVGLNALDGFDVLSISFASPGITSDWGIDRAALGLVLSVELIGMSIGSLFLGPVADKVGRRAMILACLGLMTAGMLGASTAHDVTTLSAWRILTGLGIGGMLPAINAAAAEAANARYRKIAVTLMAAGYPLGTVIGGSISSVLLRFYDWRAVFYFGAIAAIAFIPIVLRAAPESMSFTAHQRKPGALVKINATRARMGQPPLGALPPAEQRTGRSGLSTLFAPGFAARTLLLMLAYFAHVMTFYFIVKWIPKVVADMGFAPALAAQVLVSASVGGVIGSVLLGVLAGRTRLLVLTIGTMALSIPMVILFGNAKADLGILSAIAAAAGFVTTAGMVGMYVLIADTYPLGARASATGLILGIGRGGAALGPAVAGGMFATGFGLPLVAAVMAAGSGIAAISLVFFGRQKRDDIASPLPTS